MKTLKLNSSTEIPILGLGTWKLAGSIASEAVETALEIGYRLIDTADIYGNHREIGKVIKNTGVKRDSFFITSKIWHSHLHRNNVLEDAKRFLDELQTPFLDLLLIHWPNHSVPISETLEAMGSLKEQKLIRAIGVSNFEVHHLEEALKSGVEVVNNQVELHPSLKQKKLKTFCQEHKIVVTAYSPIGRGEDLHLEEITTLARKYAKTPSQIILNWITGQNIVAIPKASDPKHLEENFKAVNFSLEKEDIELINQISENHRLVHPSFAEFD